VSFTNWQYTSGRVVAQVVSHRPLSAESRVQYQASPCEICVGQSGTETGFFPSTSVFLCQYHSSNDHADIHLHVALTRKTNGWSLGTFRNQCCFGSRGTLDRKVISPHVHVYAECVTRLCMVR